MEFGRVSEKELEKIDFSLPKEPVWNKKILSGKPIKKPKVYMGCAKWGRREWVGKIYPPRTREKDFLKHYVEHYNSIELNAVHHKLYGPKATEKWASFAKGREFLFCPKMYKGVTHAGTFKSKSFLSNEFLRGAYAFGEHLGPVFLTINEQYTPKRKEELFSYLATLPKDISFFLEVRHKDFFAKKEELESLLSFLRGHDIGFVITDTAGRRDCAHMHLTVPKTFIRFVGNSLHPTDYARCDAWVRRIKSWLGKGLKELYFFMHMHDEATSPELTVYLVDKLNETCGLNLVRPRFVDESLLR